MKININENQLILCSQKEAKEARKSGQFGIVAQWLELSDKKEEVKVQLLPIIETLEKAAVASNLRIVAYAKSISKLSKAFESFYKIQVAAGGLVRNPQNQILAIYRRKHWDMPKGKTEKDETIPQTALREVKEETGLENVELQDFITTTYHSFWQRNDKTGENRRVLKISHWYNMHSSDTQLIPQTEEDIEAIEWLSPEDFSRKTPIFSNILDVLRLSGHLNLS
jgi:8-oxo-dGTP pyrophosphatase MutT (NUDIX family)